MPNLLWWVPIVSGFHDGINPCVLITASYSLLILLWFRRTGLKKFWLLFYFISLVLTSFIANCGLLDKYILDRNFIQSAKYIYVVLGLILAFYGIQFFNQWFKLTKGISINEKPLFVKKVSPFLYSFGLVLSACILSILAALWPVNYYVAVASIYVAVPGQMLIMSSIIFFYTLISLWLVIFVLWLEAISNKNVRFFKIVSSAILLSASIGVIDLFL
jgi:hypothetical protein